MVALEVPGIPRANIRPLEVPNEDPLKVCLVADAVRQEEFEPCSNMLLHIDGEILNDEVVIIHSFSSAGELEIFEPYTGVRHLGVSSDVGGWSEALWERRSLNVTTKGPWSQAIRARTPVIWSMTMPGVRVPSPLDGPARARAACSHRQER